jgi:hypothetical protein
MQQHNKFIGSFNCYGCIMYNSQQSTNKAPTEPKTLHWRRTLPHAAADEAIHHRFQEVPGNNTSAAHVCHRAHRLAAAWCNITTTD